MTLYTYTHMALLSPLSFLLSPFHLSHSHTRNTRAAMSPKLLSDMHFIYSNPFLLEKREVRREKKKKSKEPREDEDVSAGTEGSTTNESEGSESSDEGEDETVITLALAVDKSSFSDK